MVLIAVVMVEKIDISNILFDLLREHNRVSVPCLGSFVAQYHSSSVSADRKQLLPPFKVVTFNPQEIWNDERLERELARRAGCTIAEAREQVAFWVDDLCFKLATERRVRLEALGLLTISDDNQVSFTLDAELNLLKDSYGLTPVSVAKPIPVVPVQKPDSKKGAKKKSHRSYAWLIFVIILVVSVAVLVYLYNR